MIHCRRELAVTQENSCLGQDVRGISTEEHRDRLVLLASSVTLVQEGTCSWQDQGGRSIEVHRVEMSSISNV